MTRSRFLAVTTLLSLTGLASGLPELSLGGDGARSSSTRGGDEIEIDFAPANDGNETAFGVLVRFLISEDTELSPDDQVIGEATLPNLSPGGPSPRLARERVPLMVEPGLYSLIGVIDPENEIPEDDETDNTAVFGGLLVTEQGSRTVNIDFNQESTTYDGPGVLGGPDEQVWNNIVSGFGDLVFFTNFTESDGENESEIRFALPVNGRARTLGPNALLNDWISGGPFMTQGPYEFLFEGLIPGASYDLAVYSASNAVGPLGGAFTFGGETKSTAGTNQETFEEGVNYVVFEGLVADEIGNIDGIVDDNPFDGDDGYAINGLQIALVSFPGACDADLSGDGVLDLADVQAFIDAFVGGNDAADLNGDGVYDLGDVQAFVESFNQGC
jgi:hypothetical protein